MGQIVFRIEVCVVNNNTYKFSVEYQEIMEKNDCNSSGIVHFTILKN